MFRGEDEMATCQLSQSYLLPTGLLEDSLKLRQILFAIWTNTLHNLDKFISKFWRDTFLKGGGQDEAATCHLSQSYVLAANWTASRFFQIETNTFCNLDKYFAQFGHKNWTDTFQNSGGKMRRQLATCHNHMVEISQDRYLFKKLSLFSTLVAVFEYFWH